MKVTKHWHWRLLPLKNTRINISHFTSIEYYCYLYWCFNISHICWACANGYHGNVYIFICVCLYVFYRTMALRRACLTCCLLVGSCSTSLTWPCDCWRCRPWRLRSSPRPDFTCCTLRKWSWTTSASSDSAARLLRWENTHYAAPCESEEHLGKRQYIIYEDFFSKTL